MAKQRAANSDVVERNEKKWLQQREAVLNSGPMVAFSCHQDSPHQVQDVSANVLAILGYQPSAIEADPAWWQSHLHPSESGDIADGQWRFTAQDAFISRLYRIRHAEGHWCWVQEYALPPHAGWVRAYWLDITASIEEQQRLGKIAANIPGMIFQYQQPPDGGGFFSYVSEGAMSIFGRSAHEIREDRKGAWEQVHPDDKGRLYEEYTTSLNFLLPWISEFRLIQPDGRIVWVEGRATPELLSGNTRCWHGIISEITARKKTEQALRESQQQLDMAMQAASIGLWDWHVLKGRLHFSPQLLELLGMDANQPEQDLSSWQSRVHPRDLHAIRALLNKLLRRELQHYKTEYRIRNPKGGWRWVVDKGQAIGTDEHGNVNRIVGTVQDITERKQAQRLLKSSEAYFRTLFQYHGDVMILIDPEAGTIVDANPSAVRFYGYPRAELIGMHMGRINMTVNDYWQDVMNLAVQRTHSQFTFTHRLKNGALRTVDVHSSPIRSAGKTLLFSIIHDITAKKEAEDALALLQQQLLAIIENFHGAILVEDHVGNVVLVNQQYCDIFMPDKSPEQLKGQQRHELGREGCMQFMDTERMLARLVELRFSRDVVLGEECALRDGRILERDHVPIFSKGTLRGVLWVYRDISQRKVHERELRRLATTDALTGIANRRSFMEKLSEEFVRYRRFGTATSVLMMDVDHFKKVNDSYGHAAGDAVLHDFAEVCQREIREVDVLGRLGGEEFALLLPGCDLAGAKRLAERLRKAIKAHPVQVGGRQISITVSIGASGFASGQQDETVSLALADQALYEAKLAGRDQVRAFDGKGLQA